MSLGEKLRGVIERLRSATVFDKELVKEAVKELQRALISADVSVELVMRLSKHIEAEALREELPRGMNRREHVIKTMHDALAGALGGHHEAPQHPRRIMLVGLYGSGKTTTVGKLAKYYSNRGIKTAVICADTFRAAAYEQLMQVVGGVKGVEFYGNPKQKSAAAVVEECIGKAGNADLVICDSAGRSALDSQLSAEMRQIKDILKPDNVWLVLGADMGQLAEKQAKAFHSATGINGIIITRMDGSARGGGAMAACAATGAPVQFIGVGEKLDDLEEFDATRYLGRIMGYGDLKGLLEKAAKLEMDSDAVESMMGGDFNLKIFYEQLKAARQMGPLSKVMEMVGLGAKIPKEQLELSEEKLDGFKVIMDSMGEKEKLDPEIINRGRIARIAAGSGKKQEDVRELIRNYKQMKSVFKKIKKIDVERLGKKGDISALMKNFGKKKRLKIR